MSSRWEKGHCIKQGQTHSTNRFWQFAMCQEPKTEIHPDTQSPPSRCLLIGGKMCKYKNSIERKVSVNALGCKQPKIWLKLVFLKEKNHVWAYINGQFKSSLCLRLPLPRFRILSSPSGRISFCLLSSPIFVKMVVPFLHSPNYLLCHFVPHPELRSEDKGVYRQRAFPYEAYILGRDRQ